MTRICFLIRQLNGGGAQSQLLTLVKGLDKAKFDISVLTFYEGGHFYEEVKKLPHVNTICLNKRGPWEFFRFLRRYFRVMRKLKPDVIHGYGTFPSILPILFKPFFPKTRIVFGVRASNTDLSRYVFKRKVLFKMEGFLSRFADLIIVNSRAGFNAIANRGFQKEKMVVIPNGIDIDRFKPDEIARLKIRHEWGVRDGETLIGMIGRLDPMKDHPTFLKAASLMAKQNKTARFVCVGDGPEAYKEELVMLENELGLSDRLIWVGPRSDMPAVFNALDITCSSSISEGFSNVIGEAMACGVPCVVTDVGDSSNIVGETGVVVPPRNPEALVQGWAGCLTHDHFESGKEARSRIEEKFSLSRLIQRTEEALSFDAGSPGMNPRNDSKFDLSLTV